MLRRATVLVHASAPIRVTLTLAALLWCGRARAQTLVNGGEIDNQTWTARGSPYLLNEDVIVPPGKALIIEAGTSVVVSSSDLSAAGENPSLVELRIQGELYVNGTLTQPVRFWSEEASSQSGWYGIVLEPETTHARLLYTEIANGDTCLESTAPAADVEVVATTFATCGTGAYLDGGAARFDRVLVHDSGNGLWIQNTAGTTFTNLIARGNEIGMYVLSSAITLENVTFAGNTTGLSAGGTQKAPTNITLSNSIFANNTPQYKLGGTIVLAASYSDVWPAVTPSSRLTLGPGMLSVDPAFVAPPDDLHLQAASACIDAGDSATSSDHDFDRNARPLDGNDDQSALPDLGAYELFHRAFCGDGHVDAGEVCDDGDANGVLDHCSEDCQSRPGGATGSGGFGSGGFGGTTSSGGTDAGTSGVAIGSAGETATTAAGSGGEGGTPEAEGRAGTSGASSAQGGGSASPVGPVTAPAASGRPGTDVQHPDGSAGSAGASARGNEPSATSSGEAGATSAPANTADACTPGTRAECSCPDGRKGTLACEPDRTLVCYCSRLLQPAPGASGCGCRVARGEFAPAGWVGLLSALGLLVERRSPRRRRSGARSRR